MCVSAYQEVWKETLHTDNGVPSMERIGKKGGPRVGVSRSGNLDFSVEFELLTAKYDHVLLKYLKENG